MTLFWIIFIHRNLLYDKKKLFFLLKIIFLLCCLTSCFDYEEEIFLNADLSGKIIIQYTVPLKEKSNESFIAFLPTNTKKIQQKFKKKKSNLKVSNFKFSKIKNQNDLKEKFHTLGKVIYEVEFKQLSEISSILLGKTQFDIQNHLIKIKRNFQSVSLQEITSKQSKGSEKIIRTIYKLLDKHSIKFKVNFPSNWICKSNKGTIHLGELKYNLPLKESLNNNNLFWKYSLLIKY